MARESSRKGNMGSAKGRRAHVPADLGYLGDGGLGVAASSKSQPLCPRTSSRKKSRAGIRPSSLVALLIHEPGVDCLLTFGTGHLACLNLLPA